MKTVNYKSDMINGRSFPLVLIHKLYTYMGVYVGCRSLEVLYVFHLEVMYIKPKLERMIFGLHVLSII